MHIDLLSDIRQRLIADFSFKEDKGYLIAGRCPNCHKRELFTSAETPWVVKCNRLNKCGYQEHVKDIYPELFTRWSDKYQPTPENNYNKNAAADAYLSKGRGFDLSLIAGDYTQETYYDQKRKLASATVRFPLLNGYWERIIDDAHKFDSKAKFMPGTKYKGQWWRPSRMDYTKVKELWIVEGIFDAIALRHHGIEAVSIMSCNNYPDVALKELSNLGVRPTIIFALDNDNGGTRYTKQHVERARADGWLCGAAQLPKGKLKDWNDIHLMSINIKCDDPKYPFSERAIRDYKLHGRIILANSATEKAVAMVDLYDIKSFDFEYGGRWWWFEFDPEKYSKALDSIEEDAANDDLSAEERREKAMIEAKSLKQIANCYPEPLYYLTSEVSDESWYYYSVIFPHGGETIKNTFTAAQLSSSSEFKKRLLSIAPGGMYTGTNQILERSLNKTLYNIKRVETVDYVGYSAKHKCYIFNNVAMRQGEMKLLNKEDYFDFGKLSIKSLLRINQHINTEPSDYTREWSDVLWTAFGKKGFAVLTFFFGSLFAEQVRAEQDSFPFLEVVGEPATGKSTLLTFLWKLFGRDNEEGIDPQKTTPVGRARTLAQVANMPVVFIEGDRNHDDKKSHQKGFSWDELKTAYNGRSIRSVGAQDRSNNTVESPFRGTIIISQNDVVNASDAVMQRICHIYFDGEGYSEQTRKAAVALGRIQMEDVSGFILASIKREAEVMDIIKTNKDKHTDSLMANPKIHIGRLAHNHAQMLCFLDALRLVVKMTDEQYKQTAEFIEQMAVHRQEALNDDHPVVQEFWELYDYLNGDEYEPKLNHSRDNDVIAINLNEVIELASLQRQQVPVLRDIKKLLKTSKRYQYIDQRNVNSIIRARHSMTGLSVRCWIFKKPPMKG
ncbi:toprim domain-containing protein [Pelistega sp. MC2]|uniref:toprim domain-containing protein n=1 Tax=Pelistega sp. MC2 TaxID=1720297 RepID=UPI0008D9E58C|nr:toprim domain-containing protein [Pelistega sp. MC2]